MWFWVRKVIYIFEILVRNYCPHFASEKCVSEKLGRMSKDMQLLSGGTGVGGTAHSDKTGRF